MIFLSVNLLHLISKHEYVRMKLKFEPEHNKLHLLKKIFVLWLKAPNHNSSLNGLYIVQRNPTIRFAHMSKYFGDTGKEGLPFLTRRCLRQNQGLWGEDTCCDRLGMRGGRPDKRHCETVKKMNNGLWHSDKTLIRRKLPAASIYCSVTKGEDSGSPDPVPTICLKSIFLIFYL